MQRKNVKTLMVQTGVVENQRPHGLRHMKMVSGIVFCEVRRCVIVQEVV